MTPAEHKAALKGAPNPCLHCPPIQPTLHMRTRIAVGFGYAAVTCDGKGVWHEPPNAEWKKLWTVLKAENRARKNPDADWRIVMDGPLHGETYQRQGRNRWVLIEKNQGFA